MNETVYIDTTIVSYLTAWPSKDLLRAAHQIATKDWWDHQRGTYQLLTSEVVQIEAAAGDPTAAAERMNVLNALPLLPITADARHIARALLAQMALSATADRDALHVAIAASNGVEFLLTWNCSHLANATLRGKIESVCRSLGYEPPIICTPLELVR
jgi:hypothetical protein